MRAVLRDAAELQALKDILAGSGPIPVTVYDGRAALLEVRRHPAYPGQGLSTLYANVPNWIIRVGTPDRYVDFHLHTYSRIIGPYAAADYPEVKVTQALDNPAVTDAWVAQAQASVAARKAWLTRTGGSLAKPERIPGGYRLSAVWVGQGSGPAGKAACERRAARTRVSLGSGVRVESDCHESDGGMPSGHLEWRQRITAYLPDAVIPAAPEWKFDVSKPSALFPGGCHQFAKEFGYEEYGGYALFFTGMPDSPLGIRVDCVADGVTLRYQGRLDVRELYRRALRTDD
jgi:hypothetical protein